MIDLKRYQVVDVRLDCQEATLAAAKGIVHTGESPNVPPPLHQRSSLARGGS